MAYLNVSLSKPHDGFQVFSWWDFTESKAFIQYAGKTTASRLKVKAFSSREIKWDMDLYATNSLRRIYKRSSEVYKAPDLPCPPSLLNFGSITNALNEKILGKLQYCRSGNQHSQKEILRWNVHLYQHCMP